MPAPSPMLTSDTSLGSATPFTDRGSHHLFVRLSNAIAHYTSSDLLCWHEEPVALELDVEANLENLTSPCSVVAHGDSFYLFYSQNNAIHLAVSSDLRAWAPRSAEPILQSNGLFYLDTPFADPSVFYHAEEGLWWMLFSGRVPNQPLQRSGCVGLAKSADLMRWQFCSPLWMSGTEPYCHAPNLVEMSRGRWHLYYRHRQLKHRLANTARGPFRQPPGSTLISEMAGGGTRPLHVSDSWLVFPYAGAAVPAAEHASTVLATPRQLRLELDGSLSELPSPLHVESWQRTGAPIELLLGCRQLLGRWEQPEPYVHASTGQSGGCLMIPQLHGDFHAGLALSVDSPDTRIHLLMRVDDELRGGLQLTIEPRQQLLSLRAVDADDLLPPQAVRWTPMPANRPIMLDLVAYGAFVDIFVNGRLSLCGRLSSPPTGKVAVEFIGGTGKIELGPAFQLPINR